jgi:hypothetical protein
MRIATAIVSAVVLLGLFIAYPPPEGFPLVGVPQGASVRHIHGVRVFLVREGSVVTAFLGRSTDSGEPIVYCPSERAFVSPNDASLWNERGEYVAGSAQRDLDRLEVEIDLQHRVTIDVDDVIRAGRRSPGTVSGEAGQRYDSFRRGDAQASFCLNPVPRPDTVPSPAVS